MENWEGYVGVQYDTADALQTALTNFVASLKRVVDSCRKGASYAVGE